VALDQKGEIKQMKRICYIANSMIPSHWANSIQVMKMCAALAKHGIRTELVVPLHFLSWWKAIRERIDIWDWYAVPRNFRITFLPYPHLGRRFAVRGYALAAAIYARHRKPDLVYTRSNLWVPYWLSRLGCPVVFEAHDLSEERKYPIFHSLSKEMEDGSLQGVVTISKGLALAYIEEGFPSDKVYVLHDGVDLERFGCPLSQFDARKETGLPRDCPIVCYTGSLREAYGIDVLLECALHLSKVLFVFVGGAEQEVKRYKIFCKKKGLKNVLFVGWVANSIVPKYLYASDILAMPYTTKVPTDQFMSPLKMFEYLAARRPIVATDLPTIREVLVHEHNAILVKPDSAGALRSGIERILGEPALAERIAQQARRDAEKYSWSNRAKAIIERFL